MSVPKSALFALAALIVAAGSLAHPRAWPLTPAAHVIPAAHATHARAEPVSPVDWQFMRRAAALGHADVAAGRLAGQRAGDPAVRDFGKVLVSEHAMLNQRLALLSLAKQVPLPWRPAKRQRKALASLKLLRGPAFDSAFITQVATAESHTVALFEAEAAANSADPVLRSLAREFLPKLEAELRLLQDLRGRATAAR